MTRFCIALCLFLFLINVASAADDWTQQSPNARPSARNAHGMAYIGGDQVLLFGGTPGGDETWVYDLSAVTWTQRFPASMPSLRWGHGMAYIGGDQVVLFGGFPVDDETWIYDLSDNTWTQVFPPSKPSARFWSAMAYIGGDQVMLFGGNLDGAPWVNDETWVYDLSAATWTQRFPASKPSARYAHAVAHIGGDQVVLFGGNEDPVLDDETWVYDLSADAWTQQSPASHPSARRAPAMAYIGGDQVVLFGGWDIDYDDETWVYDLSADAWTQDPNATQPSPRVAHRLSETSMEGSRSPVLFGGYTASGLDDETWTFGGGDYLFPFGPMVLDIELTSAAIARISWSAVVGATEYDLYRSTTAYLNPSGIPWLIVPAPTTQAYFSDGLGDTNTNYYFLGRARSPTQTSPASNIVGEFDAALP